MGSLPRSCGTSARGGIRLMSKATNDEIQHFLNTVCKQLRGQALHDDVKSEMSTHIEEMVEELEQSGIGRQEAVRMAVLRMGDPLLIGKQLRRSHRPAVQWGLIGALLLLLIIGLFARLVSAHVVPSGQSIMLFEKQLTMVCIGFVLMLGLWFIDCRKLLNYPYWLFASGLGLAFATTMSGIGLHINGAIRYVSAAGVSIDMMAVILFIWLLALAGMKPARLWSGADTIVQLVIWLFIPVLTFVAANVILLCFLYCCAFMIAFWMTRRNLVQVMTIGLGISLAAGTLGAFYVASNDKVYYILARLMSFVSKDPNGSGYMTHQAVNAVRSAGWWGEGEALPNGSLIHIASENMFTYMIYSYGWSMGVLISAAAVLFMAMIGRIARRIQDEGGRRVAVLIGFFFGIQFAWSILMCLGMAPFVGVVLPFLSYGHSMLLIFFAACGVLLSVSKQGYKSGTKSTVLGS
ncbi:FtsW/RodA/SpoVE family cell cycle protein [Paenibacillaceae bacterium]|nr:FtsW/RodA/SpoVE family cell cycle protein [Paenibacillaceae bacterium]